MTSTTLEKSQIEIFCPFCNKRARVRKIPEGKIHLSIKGTRKEWSDDLTYLIECEEHGDMRIIIEKHLHNDISPL